MDNSNLLHEIHVLSNTLDALNRSGEEDAKKVVVARIVLLVGKLA